MGTSFHVPSGGTTSFTLLRPLTSAGEAGRGIGIGADATLCPPEGLSSLRAESMLKRPPFLRPQPVSVSTKPLDLGLLISLGMGESSLHPLAIPEEHIIDEMAGLGIRPTMGLSTLVFYCH